MKNNISMQDFYEKYNNEELTILDVRESHEYEGDYVVMYDFQASAFSSIYDRIIAFSTFTDEEFLEAFNEEFPQYGLVSAEARSLEW